MSEVFGKISLNVSVPVNSSSEKLALLEANYKFDPERIILWKLVGVDCTGEQHEVMVNDVESVELDEFID